MIEISARIDDGVSFFRKVTGVITNPLTLLVVALAVFVIVVGWPEVVPRMMRYIKPERRPPKLTIDGGKVFSTPDGTSIVKFVVTNLGPSRVRQIRLQISDLVPMTNKGQAENYIHKCKSARIESEDTDGTRDKGAPKSFVLATTESGDWKEWLFIHCLRDKDRLDRVRIPAAAYDLILTAVGQGAEGEERRFTLTRSEAGVTIEPMPL